MNNFGYSSTLPCRVCRGHNNNQMDPHFGYVVCEVHQDVPPAFLDEARKQFTDNQKTRWDKPK